MSFEGVAVEKFGLSDLAVDINEYMIKVFVTLPCKPARTARYLFECLFAQSTI